MDDQALTELLDGSGPTPPQGVVICLDDGREIPTECRYVGRRNDGMHVWLAVLTVEGRPAAEPLKVAMLPAETAIAVTVRLPRAAP